MGNGSNETRAGKTADSAQSTACSTVRPGDERIYHSRGDLRAGLYSIYGTTSAGGIGLRQTVFLLYFSTGSVVAPEEREQDIVQALK